MSSRNPVAFISMHRRQVMLSGSLNIFFQVKHLSRWCSSSLKSSIPLYLLIGTFYWVLLLGHAPWLRSALLLLWSLRAITALVFSSPSDLLGPILVPHFNCILHVIVARNTLIDIASFFCIGPSKSQLLVPRYIHRVVALVNVWLSESLSV